MKKIIAVVLVVALCLSLSACGKSEAVKNVEAMIDALGEITLESLDAIHSAENAYKALSEEEQKEIENYEILVEARNSYYELVLMGDWCVYYINQTDMLHISHLYDRLNLVLNSNMTAIDFGDGGEPITGSWNYENGILTVGEVGDRWTTYKVIEENGEIYLNMEGSNWSLMRVEDFKAYLDEIPDISEDDVWKLADTMPDVMTHPKEVAEFILKQPQVIEVELTTENWQEYFDTENIEFNYNWSRNSFDEIEEFWGCEYIVPLKEEYKNRITDLEKIEIAYELSGMRGYREIMIDIENAQVSIGDEWEDDYRPSELHTEDYTVYGYELVESGLRFGFYANNARQGGGQIADLFEVSELVRIKGTLYLFAE